MTAIDENKTVLLTYNVRDDLSKRHIWSIIATLSPALVEKAVLMLKVRQSMV